MAHHDTLNPPRLQGAKRAATRRGIAYSTFRGVIHRGEIPVLRIGRAMYVDEAEVDLWITRNKTTAGIPPSLPVRR